MQAMGVKASMSDSFLNDYLRTRSRVDQLERIENGGGGTAGAVYLTLTRTSTQNIATTDTIITWQSEDRGNGITWSGSVITIPSSGYYALDMTWQFSGTTTYLPILWVNGLNLAITTLYYGIGTRGRIMAMRHFTELDEVEISLRAATARTMLVTAYDTDNESPYLHIVKVV